MLGFKDVCTYVHKGEVHIHVEDTMPVTDVA